MSFQGPRLFKNPIPGGWEQLVPKHPPKVSAMAVPGERSEVTLDETSVPMAPEFQVKHEGVDVRAYDEEVLGAYEHPDTTTAAGAKADKPGNQIPPPLLAFTDDPLKFVVLRIFSLSFISLSTNDIEHIVKSRRYLAMAKFIKDLFPNGLSFRAYYHSTESVREQIAVQMFLAAVAHNIADLLEDTKTQKQYDDTIEVIKHVWSGTVAKLENNKEKMRVMNNSNVTVEKTRVAKNASRFLANIKSLIEKNKTPDNTRSELGDLIDTINPIAPYFSFETRHEDRFSIKVRYMPSDTKNDDDDDADVTETTKKRNADSDDNPTNKRVQESSLRVDGRVTVQVVEDRHGCTVVIRVNDVTT